ncbi:MAG: iron-sulfur cluster assembly scaffold protein [Planctomycetes bacterium]|nr:iron-sulfur cluster assembly scaffold protein [Planctomycetota bacterium]
MVSARLRQLLLAAEGGGALDGDDVRRGVADHPVCGDRVELSLRLDAGRIESLRWRAQGCPAAMAVAALAAKVLPGAALAAAPATLHAAIADHGGLEPAERHAEGLVVRALQAAGR